MVKAYTPDRGDVVWLEFDPQAGREQAGRRPAVVLSPASYNGPSGLAMVCPMTSKQKGYPFEVAIPAGLAFSGVVLADQARNLDWHQRKAKRIGKMPDDILADVVAKVITLIDPQED
jgi:mRNA interferase MazF